MRSIDETYAAEAKARWGGTEAYRAFEKNGAGKAEADGLMAIFTDFGALKDGDPASEAAQAKVRELQAYISKNYYPCTDKILLGLGRMYAADERFRANIDAAGGAGTAAFVKRAIEVYCNCR